MTQALPLAIDTLLTAVELTPEQALTLLGRVWHRGVDYADLYCQSIIDESWVLEDSIVKSGSFSMDKGFGIRVMQQEKSGYAYADRISADAIQEAGASASSIVAAGQTARARVASLSPKQSPLLYTSSNPLTVIDDDQKISLLQHIDRHARQRDPRVSKVSASLSAQYEVVLIINTEGEMTADIRPLVSIMVKVVVNEKGRYEQGYGGGGARQGYEFFCQDNAYLFYVDKAVDQALLQLRAIPAPAGAMPVVLGSGWPAVLLHEAVGHGLEADVNRKGSSAFADKMGEQIAAELCTVVDDATLSDRRGSLAIDDEGTPGERTVLIENGVLKNYMQDRQNAKLMKMALTGNGRRESYAHLPIPRMTNTYLLPGQSDPQEIIASVAKGLYAVDFLGGQVDPVSGKFVFSASEAYLIENGKVVQPVRGATLVGHGPEILTKVTMVGNDLAFDKGLGTCGKAGQSVPVGVGQPTLKLSEITVGGVA